MQKEQKLSATEKREAIPCLIAGGEKNPQSLVRRGAATVLSPESCISRTRGPLLWGQGWGETLRTSLLKIQVHIIYLSGGYSTTKNLSFLSPLPMLKALTSNISLPPRRCKSEERNSSKEQACRLKHKYWEKHFDILSPPHKSGNIRRIWGLLEKTQSQFNSWRVCLNLHNNRQRRDAHIYRFLIYLLQSLLFNR